jgi:hypothetical protein
VNVKITTGTSDPEARNWKRVPWGHLSSWSTPPPPVDDGGNTRGSGRLRRKKGTALLAGPMKMEHEDYHRYLRQQGLRNRTIPLGAVKVFIKTHKHRWATMEIGSKSNRRFTPLQKEINFTAIPIQIEYDSAEDTRAELPVSTPNTAGSIKRKMSARGRGDHD